MNPMFAVQITGRDDRELHKTVDALKAAGLDYETFGCIPFTDEITNLEAFPSDRRVIPLAGTKVLSMWQRGCLPPNWHVFYDAGHLDQYLAQRFYGTNLLNYWAEVRPFSQMKDRVWDVPMFVKPTDDGKAFAGLVLEGESLSQALEKQTHQVIADDQPILVSDCKTLGREFRLFVVDGYVVDISEYRNRGQIQHKDVAPRLKADLRDYFQSVCHPSAPRAYVMDVGEVWKNGEWRWCIIELNCFNCSGAYTVDRAAVYGAVANAI
ncbi:hypothetical protein [Ralstonia phage phiRSL1]|uniref:ATP-grasp domain-containing protein n=1 Tax=Ralstonia phage phiRSL1 TaxID=1980924 RepID=B2ZYK8_9CAUD|nr:hypothetical protein RSL1_ORF336 [Ralstonia phage phiRSL1]BAG41784.1 hypothetical protein [Ralstonia phage phiRSL1]